MQRPVLKRGRQNAAIADTQVRPGKKPRSARQSSDDIDDDDNDNDHVDDLVQPEPSNANSHPNNPGITNSNDRPLLERFVPPAERKLTNSKLVGVQWETVQIDGKSVERVAHSIKIKPSREPGYYARPPTYIPAANPVAPVANQLGPAVPDAAESSTSDQQNDDICALLAIWIAHMKKKDTNFTAELKDLGTFTHAQITQHIKVAPVRAPAQEKLNRNMLYMKQRPFSSIEEIFDDMIRKVVDKGFLKACEPFQKQGLQVITFCSGTESPVVALQLSKDAIESISPEYRNLFNFKHVASAEIVPFKQAYIQRNFDPPLLFRDVTEFNDRHTKPHTAFGGVASQPSQVHMVIAGASCVDYSSLNNAKKNFAEDGQSYSTFMGIISYCEWAKPAIIILENVDGCPWGAVVDSLKFIGYTAICFKVDTKDFYLPQTRQRGYVIAFHDETAKEKKFNLKQAFKDIHDTLRLLACPASAPFTDFIYGDNNPELFLTRRLLANPDRNSSKKVNVAWTASQHRYNRYRVANKLGSKRPYTHWRADGKSTPPDYSWVEWIRTQPERVLDTLDIKYLFALAKRGYDINYKCRWAELSQNVDRDLDSRPWGIVNCLTPSGMPFETRRGGSVSGKEVMFLQGMPGQMLKMNTENPRQLQDLAGNAMSTTVVGATILAAILGSLKPKALDSKVLHNDDSMFGTFLDMPDLDLSKNPPALLAQELVTRIKDDYWSLVSTQNNCRNSDEFHLHKFQDIAKRTMQLCRCEGPTGWSSTGIRICVDCGHTCCVMCASNPPHNYLRDTMDGDGKISCLPSDLKLQRQSPADFAEYVRTVFPIAITLSSNGTVETAFEVWCEDYKDKNIKDDTLLFLETITLAVQDEYVFSGVQRDSI